MLKEFYAVMFTAVILLSTALHADNMLKNGSLDTDDISEFSPTGLANSYKYSVFTEDLTWNRCARLDIMPFEKSLSIGVVIGGAKGGDGQDGRNSFSVKPNTTYEFSIDMKGTVRKAGVNAFIWEGECKDYKDKKLVKTDIGGINVQPEWVRYNGKFTTGPAAKKAALWVQLWCDEKQGGITEKPGTYLLIDNVSIQEKNEKSPAQSNNSSEIKVEPKNAACAPFIEKAPAFEEKNSDLWSSAPEISSFVKTDDIEEPAAKTSVKILAAPDALWMLISCDEPEMSKIKAAFNEDGAPLWQDDCVELFFDTATEGITVRQFIVNSLGKRMMTWGTQAVQPPKADYEKWEAKAFKENSKWNVQIKITYEALGLKGRPESGFAIPFNVARERHAGKTELSSWSKVSGNFSRKEKYGLLVFGSLKDNLGKKLALLKNEIQKIPADIPEGKKKEKENILKNLSKWENAKDVSLKSWEETYIDMEKAIKETGFLILSNCKFAATQVSVTDDFKVPYMPERVNASAKEEFRCRAAVNEFKSFPVALTNLTDKTETYRVILFSKEDNGIEISGLETQNGNIFPPEAISLKEAVRIKDSDAVVHGQRFDPLSEMNKAYTITVPPKESGLVWITFNCTDIKPGTYSGTLRIIPLDQQGKFNFSNGWKYEGQMKDMPFNLEIMPFELSKAPAIPLWVMRDAANETFFKDMIEHGNRVFQLSPWLFNTTFDKDGSIKSVDNKNLDRMIQNHLDWAKKYNTKITFLVGFSCYDTFYNQFAKKAFAYQSPEWEKAWAGWLNTIQEAFKRHNVPEKDYVLEVFDEPKNYSEAVYCLKKAKETHPTLRLSVTLGYPLWAEDEIRNMIPFIDDMCIWDGYWTSDNRYEKVINELQSRNKTVAYYTCSAGNILMPTYSYYRLFAWKGYFRKLDTLGLFIYLAGPGGYYGRLSWKCDSFGGLIYNSFNTPVTSIRYEILRESMDDIKYLKKLGDLLKTAEAKKLNNETIAKAAKMFVEVPRNVAVVYSHKNGYADQAREQLSEMIIELQNALKEK